MYTTEKLFLQRKNLLLRESVGWKETPIFCVTTPSQPQQEARMGTAKKEAGRLCVELWTWISPLATEAGRKPARMRRLHQLMSLNVSPY